MQADEAQAVSLRDLVFAAEQAYTAAREAGAEAQGTEDPAAAAESSLLQLGSLLCVTAGSAPAGRQQADALLQQCASRLHNLSVQQRQSDAR